jgi:hypothetical protein
VASVIELLGGAVSGAVASAVIVWMGRVWISERLKQAISHEYSTKLENIRADFGVKLEAFKHAHEVNQLRTSLFFDHQRSAFGEILSKVVELNQAWSRLIDPERDSFDPAPREQRSQLEALYYKHQLFLDTELVMAMELLFDVYSDSLPFWDGEETHDRDVQVPFATAEFLQPRLAALFRLKIGVGNDRLALRQIALLGAIRTVNRYHFSDVGIPVTGPLKIAFDELAQNAVTCAEENVEALIEKLKQFQQYLRTSGYFHEAEASVRRYLEVLVEAKPR